MKKGLVLSILVISLIFLSLSFVSASWFGDLIGKITGKAIEGSGSGLVFMANFNEDSGLIVDSSGYNNNGLATTMGSGGILPYWVASGKYGGAYQFAGVNNSIVVPNNAVLNLNQTFTISVWVYPIDDGRGYQDAIVVKGSSFGWGGNYNYRIGREKVNLYTWGTTKGTAEYNFDVGVPAFNTWQFLTLTADGSYCVAYVNGIRAGSRDCAGPYNTFTNPLQIGGTNSLSDTCAKYNLCQWSGKIDEVRVYNRVLSQSEILEVMNKDSTGILPASTPVCTPTTEICNSKDDDCDGAIDENSTTICGSGYNCSNGACVVSVSATCTDSDGGLNYNVKGIVNFSSSGSAIDVCANANQLMEFKCENDGSFSGSYPYTCPNGCSDGACNPLTPSNSVNGVCGNITYIEDASGLQPVYNCLSGTSVGGRVGYYINTWNSAYLWNCTGSSGGISASCVDEDVVCVETDEDKTLPYDYGRGSNKYIYGAITGFKKVYGTNGTVTFIYQSNKDTCSDSTLTEYICDGDVYSTATGPCPYGCSNGACICNASSEYPNCPTDYICQNGVCIKESLVAPICSSTCTINPATCPNSGVQTETCVNSCDSSTTTTDKTCTPGTCSGCDYDGKCMAYGIRVNVPNVGERYCDVDSSLLVPLKSSDETCTNNFECESNLCIDGTCLNASLWQSILNWFKNLFG